MGNPEEYIRIGTSYYKIVSKPLASGDSIIILLNWTGELIKQDHGKAFLSTISKYDGFCFIPSHLNYQRGIGTFYNRYHPFNHRPLKGNAETTLCFLRHIFGEQIELGLDYLKILLEQPLQVLPILCLVSQERNTGKTTFLNYLKAIFGDNMTINSNEDFRSNFNSEWIYKLIIGVDETFLDRKEDSERLKNLSTALKTKAEGKFLDRHETEFFGKFILCSNNEDSFAVIDPGEIRYWVHKIPPLQKDNVHLLEELKTEIPFFLHFLINRPFTTRNETRMWFRPDQIATAALKKVIKQNRNRLELEIAQILLYIIDTKELKEIFFCLKDVQDWLGRQGIRNIDVMSIRRILQNVWNLQPATNSLSYFQYRFASDGILYEYMQKGRYYRLFKDEVLKLNE